nr:PREDICTED: snRNA-activating protein complex subunit 4 [Latimeria chalumnae]|eukprot:XP_005987488.2 PREDICTED: snRNA-activating protein complex subunit 4 [Latimeria chalumnae]
MSHFGFGHSFLAWIDTIYHSPSAAGNCEGENEEGIDLPEDPEMCLQLNIVYQQVVEEKLQEVEMLLKQNREQQEKIMWKLSGVKPVKKNTEKTEAENIFVGHFMKPYFKDKITGLGPTANPDTREREAQGIKSFEELVMIKWKTREKAMLQQSVISNRLQRRLQPKLFRLEYLTKKMEKAKSDLEKQTLEKQIRDAEREMDEIQQQSQDKLLGNRLDEHDWDKIANIDFEGRRRPEEIRKFWQNSEHPGINKAPWSDQEVETLKELASKHNHVDWETIARELGTNRTAFMCLQKYQFYNKDFKKKEWTKKEDRMLKELVQRMRIGNYIPYKKIAYFMEGRNSVQLIHRWTKSVNPSLKRGYWTPEEDEVSCALTWRKREGPQTKKKKVLIVKLHIIHFVGNWTKIASEFPNRTSSQCLSKWKIMIGTNRKRRKLKPKYKQRYGRDSRYSSDSSESLMSSSEDSESMALSGSSEGELESEEEKSPKIPKYVVPSVDLWIPSREEAVKTQIFSIVNCTENQTTLPAYSKAPCPRKEGPDSGQAAPVPAEGSARRSSVERSTILVGIGQPVGTDICATDPTPFIKEASQLGKQVLKITPENVKTVLQKNNMIHLNKLRKQMKKTAVSRSSVPPVPQDEVQGWLPGMKERPQKKTHRSRCLTRLFNINLNRKLMMVLTPWVGNVLLVCTARPDQIPEHGAEADIIRDKLESVGLTSTIVFTLLIKLFQIDTEGCMKVIQERRTKKSEFLKAVGDRYRKPQEVSGLQDVSGNKCLSQQSTSENERSSGILTSIPQAPRKRKTVFELLQEKRMREGKVQPAVQHAMCKKVQPAVQHATCKKAQVGVKKLLPLIPPVEPSSTANLQSRPLIVNDLLPISWVVTPQGLVALPVQALLGMMPQRDFQVVPSQSALCNQHQTANASDNLSTTSTLTNQAAVSVANGNSAPNLLRLLHQSGIQSPAGANQSSSTKQPHPVCTSEDPSTAGRLPAQTAAADSVANLATPSHQSGIPSPASAGQSIPGMQRPHVGVSDSCAPAAAKLPDPPVLVTNVLNNMCVPAGAQTQLPENKSLNRPLGSSSSGSSQELNKSSQVVVSERSVNVGSTRSVSSGNLPPASASLSGTALPQPGSSASSQEKGVSGAVPVSSQATAGQDGPSSKPAVPNVVQSMQCFFQESLKVVPQPSLLTRTVNNAPVLLITDSSQSASGQPTPCTPQPDKSRVDLGLLFFDESLAKEWSKGNQGVHVPLLKNTLPYLPPNVCTLKTLSRLLLQKVELEQSLSGLVSTQEDQAGHSSSKVESACALVARSLRTNPAYLLLKARFLAAFTLPAFLATVSPPGLVMKLSSPADCELSAAIGGERSTDDESVGGDSNGVINERLNEKEVDGDILSEHAQAVSRHPEFTEEMNRVCPVSPSSSSHSEESISTGLRRCYRLRKRKQKRK